jgi:hypothetical protein
VQSRSARCNQVRCAGRRGRLHAAGLAAAALLVAALPCCCCRVWAGQAQSPPAELPEAPQPQESVLSSAAPTAPCLAASGARVAVPAALQAAGAGNAPPAGNPVAPACPPPAINWYMRFTNGPQVKPLTAKEKGWLAVRNVVDPFNAITILGSSAIAVGFDAHSPYGPGMPGFGRYVGVSYTQDLTGEFLCTFLIPSIVHQDPHYHRLPNASIQRRIAHAMYQVVWTQGDNGRGMVNYAYIVGAAASDEVNNLYVPGRETNMPASAARWGIGLATAPIDNFVSEFLPDLARHIHVQIVVIQRIINQVAKTDGPAQP